MLPKAVRSRHLAKFWDLIKQTTSIIVTTITQEALVGGFNPSEKY